MPSSSVLKRNIISLLTILSQITHKIDNYLTNSSIFPPQTPSSPRTHAYVLRQMLHVVALIVKRSILSRDAAYLDTFVSNVCSLFTSSNTLNLGLEIAAALLAEFTVADKTLSSYMSYQHNIDCKRSIEVSQKYGREKVQCLFAAVSHDIFERARALKSQFSDQAVTLQLTFDCSHQGNALYKIFMSTMEVIDQLKNSPVSQHRREWLQLMSILNSVLSWDFGVILCQSLFILVNVPGLKTLLRVIVRNFLYQLKMFPGIDWS